MNPVNATSWTSGDRTGYTGDAWALRGIPAISTDGLGGVMPGTHPEQHVLANDPFGDDD